MSVDQAGERRERIVRNALKAGTVALAISAGSIAIEKADNGWAFSLGCTPQSQVVTDNKKDDERKQLPDQPESPEIVIRGESNE